MKPIERWIRFGYTEVHLKYTEAHYLWWKISRFINVQVYLQRQEHAQGETKFRTSFFVKVKIANVKEARHNIPAVAGPGLPLGSHAWVDANE